MKQRNPATSGRRVEWLVALASSVLAGLVYVFSMPPSVTMYSGAYVTASFGLGVPITPGYPFWTVCGFLWSHCILPVGNPAWRLSMMSATAGAAVVGVMSLTMMRSTTWLIGMLPWGKAIDPKRSQWIAVLVGMSTALMFGFDSTVWQWACEPEPQALYTLLYFLAVASFFVWIRDPTRRRYLYATVMLFSLTVATADLNCWQATLVLAIPFFVGVLAIGIEAAIAVWHGAAVSSSIQEPEKE